MISALFYLHFTQTWNRLRTRVKRLKQPKYMAGAVIGALYLYWYFGRVLFGGPRRMGTGRGWDFQFADHAGVIELVGAAALLVFILAAWIFPHERAALMFTEAEATTLFAAPIRRRTLIHFKLIKSQAGILFTTLLFTFFSSGFGSRANGWIHLAGWWMILSVINLHFLAASFTRTKLLDRGITNWKRRGIIFGILGVIMCATFLWARDAMRPPADADLATGKAMASYASEILQAGPLPYLLYPFRLMVRPYLATDVLGLLAASWPVLLLLIAHYLWVMRSEVAFEEASLALAQKRAQLVAAARQGQLTPGKRKPRRDPFVLAPTGPPAVALLWKNLVAAGNLFTPRTLVLVAIVLGVPAVMMSLNASRSGSSTVFGMLLMMVFIWSLLLGPQILRQDFRTDLKSIDVLKLYPLPGWRVVLGELLAPAAILTAVQWLVVLLALILTSKLPGGQPIALGHRLAIGLGAAMVVPMLNIISLLIPNAAVLLFPAWFQSGQDATQGIEAAGQRIIFALGQFLAFFIALIPAALAFLVVFFTARFAIAWAAAVPLAALAASLVLAAEAAVGIAMLGKVFEKFDLSSEPQT